MEYVAVVERVTLVVLRALGIGQELEHAAWCTHSAGYGTKSDSFASVTVIDDRARVCVDLSLKFSDVEFFDFGSEIGADVVNIPSSHGAVLLSVHVLNVEVSLRLDVGAAIRHQAM
jgi:hypothetical protein